MAKFELDKSFGITSLSGKLGGVVYRTLKSGKIIATSPSKPRSNAPSAAELAARKTFSRIASEVARRMRAGDKRPKSIIWQEVKLELNKGQVRGMSE